MTVLALAPVVRVRGVGVRLGTCTALAGVDLDAGPGVTGLLGPNGAGKTTLLRVMATVLAPSSGSLRLLGLDTADPVQRREARRRLGWMPQEPGLHRSATVAEFLDYVAVLKELGTARQRRGHVARVVEAADLAPHAGRRIRTLSLGQRRRVGFAQALLGDPQVLLLDEPTAGLDPEQRLRFREVVSAVGVDRCVVVSTHQTDDVAMLCQRAVVLAGGTTAWSGPTASLLRTAEGRVWCSGSPDGGGSAVTTWRDSAGRWRHVGDPPAGADLVPPTLEDAYLLLRRPPSRHRS